MSSTIYIFGLLALALVSGAAGVGLLFGAGWLLIFVSACAAGASFVLIKGASGG